jgi:hypothetical protein
MNLNTFLKKYSNKHYNKTGKRPYIDYISVSNRLVHHNNMHNNNFPSGTAFNGLPYPQQSHHHHMIKRQGDINVTFRGTIFFENVRRGAGIIEVKMSNKGIIRINPSGSDVGAITLGSLTQNRKIWSERLNRRRRQQAPYWAQDITNENVENLMNYIEKLKDKVRYLPSKMGSRVNTIRTLEESRGFGIKKEKNSKKKVKRKSKRRTRKKKKKNKKKKKIINNLIGGSNSNNNKIEPISLSEL